MVPWLLKRDSLVINEQAYAKELFLESADVQSQLGV